MKHTGWFVWAAVGLLVFNLQGAGSSQNGCCPPGGAAVIQPAAAVRGHSPAMVLLAQHASAVTAKDRPAKRRPEEQKTKPVPEKGLAAPETRTSGTKPLKPFQPSERIKADQAVDFPYDI